METPPAYTSQTCSRCHHVHPVKGKSYRSSKLFKCEHCGFEHDMEEAVGQLIEG